MKSASINAILYGASAQALCLARQMRMKNVKVLGCLVSGKDASEEISHEFEILGSDQDLPRIVANHADLRFFILVNVSGGRERSLRQRLFEYAMATGLQGGFFVGPGAYLSATASVGQGVLLSVQSIVNDEASLGDNVLINTGAIVEHNASIEDHSVLAPKACVCGGAYVGKNCHIGPGAVLIDNVRIGEGSVIGASSVVTRDVPPGVVAYGNPARVVRKIR